VWPKSWNPCVRRSGASAPSIWAPSPNSRRSKSGLPSFAASATTSSVRSTIARLNRLSKQRFQETFEEVNRIFQATFPKLFHGGKASLALTDPENLLETGVEIFVQPPGKRVGNLELLSGGEKAMTAIGLIFALFLHKPSPFCVLD